MGSRLVIHVLCLIFAGLALAKAQPVPPADVDGRVRVDPNSQGNEFLRPIGLLIDRKSKKTATGVLISNCHVLTNRHAVGGIRKSETGHGEEVVEDFDIDVTGNVLEFQIGFDVREPFKLRSTGTATVIASGAGGDVDDWALLRLNRHLGKRHGAAALRGTPFTAGESVITAGYAADKLYVTGGDGSRVFDFWLWKQEGLLHEDRAYWVADLDVSAGQSGSPVFAKEAGGYVMVGLLRAELPPTPAEARAMAQIVPLKSAIDRMAAAQQRHPCN